MFANAGPMHAELARHAALAVASGGQAEINVDPVERIRLEELARVAELNIADFTGVDTSVSGRGVTVRSVTRGEWALATLKAWGPLLESVAQSLSGADAKPGEAPGAESFGSLFGTLGPSGAKGSDVEAGHGQEFDWGSGLAGLLGQAAQAVGPALIGMQFGSAVGDMARRCLGQYEVLVPRPASDEILVVAENITSFAEDWSLPPDDVRLWIALHEMTVHILLSRQPVRDRLNELLAGYAGGFVSDGSSIEERLTGFDPGDPEGLQATLSDPSLLLGELLSPTQVLLGSQLRAITAAIYGWVDFVVESVGRKLIVSYDSLSEALSRRRAERGEGVKFAECVFGLDMSQAHYDRGTKFIAGIVERAGEEALPGLWSDARHLPTPAEVDAPGLWLERISIPDGE